MTIGDNNVTKSKTTASSSKPARSPTAGQTLATDGAAGARVRPAGALLAVLLLDSVVFLLVTLLAPIVIVGHISSH